MALFYLALFIVKKRVFISWVSFVLKDNCVYIYSTLRYKEFLSYRSKLCDIGEGKRDKY